MPCCARSLAKAKRCAPHRTRRGSTRRTGCGQRWAPQYGEDSARAIALAHQHEAPADISLKTADADAPDSAPLFGLSRRLTRAGRVESCRVLPQGGWWVQDAAATLPVLMLGDVRGKRVIDLCAAPGGKTMQLAAAGAEVIAVELEPLRLARVQENLDRTQLAASLVKAMRAISKAARPSCCSMRPAPPRAPSAAIPNCPGSRQPADVTARAPLAYEILESGAAMVDAGGVLVFAVCSLEREEGEEQIEAFLAAQSRIRPRAFVGGRDVRPQRMDHAAKAICAPCPVILPSRAAWTASMRQRLETSTRTPRSPDGAQSRPSA